MLFEICKQYSCQQFKLGVCQLHPPRSPSHCALSASAKAPGVDVACSTETCRRVYVKLVGTMTVGCRTRTPLLP
jgi:hypothetical protein